MHADVEQLEGLSLLARRATEADVVLGFGDEAVECLPADIDAIAAYIPPEDMSQCASYTSALGELGKLVGYHTVAVVPYRNFAASLDATPLADVLYDESGNSPQARFVSDALSFSEGSLLYHLDPAPFPELEKLFLAKECRCLVSQLRRVRAAVGVEIEFSDDNLCKLVEAVSNGNEDLSSVRRVLPYRKTEAVAAPRDVAQCPIAFCPPKGQIGEGAVGLAERMGDIVTLWSQRKLDKPASWSWKMPKQASLLEFLGRKSDVLGISAMVDAYYAGVPLEDILA